MLFRSSSGVVLTIYTLILLAALIWAFVFAFVDFENDIMSNINNPNRSYLVWPQKWNFSNIVDVYNSIYCEIPYGTSKRVILLPEMFVNSILYSLGVSFMSTLAPCIMSYVTAKFRFKFNTVVDSIVLITISLPIVGALPSQIRIVYGLNLDNSIIGLWIMAFGFASMYYFVFKAAFIAIPNSLSESASLDGAGNFRIFIKIMLPLVKITFASVMLICFVSAWNNYTTPLAFSPHKPTVAYGLFRLIQGWGTRINEPTLKMMGAMMLMIPILIVYALLNKKLMGNLTVGGVKG